MRSKKTTLTIFVSACFLSYLGLFAAPNKVQAESLSNLQPINQMYNPNTGEHLYTPSQYEQVTLLDYGWQDEGFVFYVPIDGRNDHPYVYRLYNLYAKDHHYTTDENETANLMRHGWKNDFIGFPTAGQDGVPVYRVYNPNAISGAHYFTLNIKERDHLVHLGWQDEGVAFRAYPYQ